MSLATEVVLKVSTQSTATGSNSRNGLRSFIDFSISLGNGTATGKADVQYLGEDRVLGGSATENLDFSGALEEPDGTAAVFAKVKCFQVKNTGAGSLIVSVPANGLLILDAVGDAHTIAPGGVFSIYNPVGIAVTAGTADLVTFTADATGCTYSVIVVGTSA